MPPWGYQEAEQIELSRKIVYARGRTVRLHIKRMVNMLRSECRSRGKVCTINGLEFWTYQLLVA